MTGGFYFAPPEAIRENTFVLPPDESRHASKVMRLSKGDEIQIVDGAGMWYRARIERINRSAVAGRILETAQNVGEPSYQLTFGFGMLKNTGRFETFLEKAVELGVAEIVPILTERTQRLSLNRSRCNRIMVAGLKQSMRSRLPGLTEERTLADFLSSSPDDELALLAHEGASQEATLLRLADEIRSRDRIAILVGPEGGFSEAETDQAESHGWRLVTLGSSRLRAETAAIAAAATIHMIKSAP